MQKVLQDLKVDRVYAFNGRYATMRAVLRAAQGQGIDCFLHERGSTFERYSLFKNHLLHEVDHYQTLIESTWSEADPDIREAVGASFFAGRLVGHLGNWVSFSNKQQTGLLPKDWRERPNNIVAFTTSSDEIDALSDVIFGTFYKDQYEALERMSAAALSDPDTHFYVRVHPRTQFIPDPGVKILLSKKLPNVTIIPGDSLVSTYTLMRRATKVVSFGSTTGIEAAYWGIPSIICMRSFYDRLGSTYNPASHEETMRLLLSRSLPAKDRLGALKYGYFEKTLGLPFRYFQPTGINGGAFKGSQLKPNLGFRTAGWLVEHGVGRDSTKKLHLKLAESRLTGP
jgi:hypothetical protein